MKWLAECSVAALREALEAVAPELSRFPVTVPGPAGKEDPQWHSGCVPVRDQFFVKFAWSHPAALQLAREIGVLAALARGPAVPFLPEVVASSTDPLLLITRRVPGASLFEVADSINPDHAARQLVRFLAALHHPATRHRVEAAVGPITGPVLPPAMTPTMRDRFGTWIRPDQRRTVIQWCDWADAVLASPGPAVLVHGDFHGNEHYRHEHAIRFSGERGFIRHGDPLGPLKNPRVPSCSPSGMGFCFPDIRVNSRQKLQAPTSKLRRIFNHQPLVPK